MGRPIEAERLTFDQIASMLARLDGGETPASIGAAFGVSHAAVNYWKRYGRRDGEWIRYLRELEHRALMQARHLAKRERQLAAATHALCALIRSSERRADWAKRLITSHGLPHAVANEVFGLTLGAGSRVQARGDEFEIEAKMRAYTRRHRSHGFLRMVENAFAGSDCPRHRLKQIYREAGLTMVRGATRPMQRIPNHVPKKRAVPAYRDAIWSIDWMMVEIARRRYWIFNAIDDYSRECVVSRVSKRSTTKDVCLALSHAMRDGRQPQQLRSDNGTCFRSAAFVAWTRQRSIEHQFIRPGHPEENVFVERLNWTLRRELLDLRPFATVASLQRALRAWRKDYNTVRGHRSLGGLSPLAFAARGSTVTS